MTNQSTALDDYIIFYEQMKREDLVRLTEFFTPQAHFKDPFNDIYGVEQIRTVFHHMFETITVPKFVIEEAIFDSNVAYIKWEFTGELKTKPLKLVGISRVVFDEAGRVSEHIDYWDASEQFYMKLPIVGSILRFIRRQAAS